MSPHRFFGRRPDSDRDAGPEPPALRPAPPIAKRLNRNALTVAAVIMGMTVLTAVVILTPGRRDPATPAPAADDAAQTAGPTRPTFLDEPARIPPTGATPMPADSVADRSVVTSPSDEPRRQADAPTAPPTTELDASFDGLPSTTTPPVASMRPARERAYAAAVTSPMLLAGPVRSPPTTASGVTRPDEAPSLAAEESHLLGLGDSVLRSSLRPPTSASTVAGDAPPPSSPSSSGAVSPSRATDRRRAFLDVAASDERGSSVLARLEPAGSPYTLRAGTVIPGVLLTAINSDLPGDVVGQVTRTVYDSRTQRVPLIPKGARLVGTYDDQVAAGQGRLLVAWTRLILPDGRSMRLPGLPLKDLAGQTGVAGGVDDHWRRVFGHALLLSAIGAGAQLGQPAPSTVLAPPSAGQVAAGALGQELSSVALEIVRRGMNVAPTITVPQGQPFNVFLNGDLVFDGPYVEESVTPMPGR